MIKFIVRFIYKYMFFYLGEILGRPKPSHFWHSGRPVTAGRPPGYKPDCPQLLLDLYEELFSPLVNKESQHVYFLRFLSCWKTFVWNINISVVRDILQWWSIVSNVFSPYQSRTNVIWYRINFNELVTQRKGLNFLIKLMVSDDISFLGNEWASKYQMSLVPDRVGLM